MIASYYLRFKTNSLRALNTIINITNKKKALMFTFLGFSLDFLKWL